MCHRHFAWNRFLTDHAFVIDAEDVAFSLVEVGALRVDPSGEIVRVAILREGRLRMLSVPRVCRPSPGNGYVHVVVRAPNGRRHVVKGHRLVWRALRGRIPAGSHVRHRNRQRGDNRLENLDLIRYHHE